MRSSLVALFKRPLELFPDKPAAIDGETMLTYREFGERVHRLANGMRALGLKEGDAVAALCMNHHRYLEIYFACHCIGVIINPLNIRLAAAEIIYILNDSESRLLFIDQPFLPMLDEIRAGSTTLEHIYYSDAGVAPEGMLPMAALMDGQSVTCEYANVDEESIAGYFYTGGTTGLPKGVMLTVRNLVANAFQLQSLKGYIETDVYLHIAPMFHLADLASLYAVTMVGGTHITGRAFDPKLTLELIQKHKVTAVLLVPTMINFVLSHPDFDKYDLSSLRRVMYGASPMPVPLLRRVMEKFPCPPTQGYGMTEAAPVVTNLTDDDHIKGMTEPKWEWLLGTAGRPVPGVEIKIVDGNDNEVAIGEAGEILARGPNIMKGYLKKPEATAEAFLDDWYRTGDVAIRNECGYITIVDRKKDMIISGGENIYTTEVENVLMQFPGILETTVIGVPDDKWGEVVKAFVVMKQGVEASPHEIIEFTKARLANYKCPKSVEFLDALPKSGAGKILKRDLREKYWTTEGRRVH